MPMWRSTNPFPALCSGEMNIRDTDGRLRNSRLKLLLNTDPLSKLDVSDSDVWL